MSDNGWAPCGPLLGPRIRALRLARGWTLAELARRVGTSAPTLHRYENGWDRFELATLRRIATALGARLDVRLVEDRQKPPHPPRSADQLVAKLRPLFWEKPLAPRDLDEHPDWVIARTLMYGDLEQVRALRGRFPDEALLAASTRRGIDERTRNFWALLLAERDHASQGSR